MGSFAALLVFLGVFGWFYGDFLLVFLRVLGVLGVLWGFFAGFSGSFGGFYGDFPGFEGLVCSFFWHLLAIFLVLRVSSRVVVGFSGDFLCLELLLG